LLSLATSRQSCIVLPELNAEVDETGRLAFRVCNMSDAAVDDEIPLNPRMAATLPTILPIPGAESSRDSVATRSCDTSRIALILLHVEFVTRSTTTIYPRYLNRNR
jgi:hypothetical protein